MKASEIKKEINAELEKAREKTKNLQTSKISNFTEVQMAIESLHEDTKLIAVHVRQNTDKLTHVQRDLEAQFVEFELDHQEELKFIKNIFEQKNLSAIGIDENYRKLLLNDIEEKNKTTIEQVKRIVANQSANKQKPIFLYGLIIFLFILVAILFLRS
jgi:hypothetical protein